jgi:alpha-beta hydrolase superfamily lysophospholipase
MALACIAFLAEGNFAHAQGKEPEPDPVKIITVDGVRLNAVFYPSPKKNSPAVIMLHPIGDGKSSKSREWKGLATTLQKNGYSVVTFDFRGHGESTSIDSPNVFWTVPANRNFVRTKDKATIEVKDFIKNGAYLPTLVNDIAAIRTFLDEKNDQGQCNSSSIIVIGAESGATLGAIWINSEWNRYKYLAPMNPMFMKGTLDKRPEGNNITAAIFLTIQPELNTYRKISVGGVLARAVKFQATPTIFFSGKDDKRSTDFAKALESRLKGKGDLHRFTGAVALKTNLTGMKLLQTSLKTNDAMVDWLDKVVAERGNRWSRRDFPNSFYMWRSPVNANFIWPAKMLKGEQNLGFDTYERFITQ